MGERLAVMEQRMAKMEQRLLDAENKISALQPKPLESPFPPESSDRPRDPPEEQTAESEDKADNNRNENPPAKKARLEQPPLFNFADRKAITSK